MPAPSPLPPTAQTATASDLVRHFGEWQRRAAIAPVYVLHHRRPQFVLASIEFLQALSASTSASTSAGARSADDQDTARILDALAEPVLIVGRDGAIVAAGRAARLCLGDGARAGGRIEALFADGISGDDRAEHLAMIVERVAATSLGERSELPARDGAPWLTLTIEPHPAGAIIVGRAAETEAARDAAIAQLRAMTRAFTTLPGAAIATIDLRGRLIDPDESLARLTGRSREALDALSADALFAPASRQPIAQTIDRAFAGGATDCVQAELLTADARPLAVTAALAPVRRAGHTTTVLAAIMKRG